MKRKRYYVKTYPAEGKGDFALFEIHDRLKEEMYKIEWPLSPTRTQARIMCAVLNAEYEKRGK